ncbi:MAG: hypothetical protein LBV55_01345 [Acholeplasmatales bacterium]|jgi:hypothetical protein|nr:hypothetical protein [Acholeplasmatales bacterium]
MLILLNDTQTKLLIGVIIAVAALLVLITLTIIIKTKKSKKSVIVKDNVRYTNEASLKGKAQSVTFNVGDFLVKVGTRYTSTKKGPLLPGKYVVKTGDSNQKSFYLRINGLNRNFNDNSELVLAENDVLEAVNCNVVLR